MLSCSLSLHSGPLLSPAPSPSKGYLLEVKVKSHRCDKRFVETHPLTLHPQTGLVQELAGDFPPGTGESGIIKRFKGVLRMGPFRNLTKKSHQQAGKRPEPSALPAPPHCDAVQRIPLQLMIIAEEVNRHLVPLGPAEPGDHDALSPEWRRPFLFDALSVPCTPHEIHPLEIQN